MTAMPSIALDDVSEGTGLAKTPRAEARCSQIAAEVLRSLRHGTNRGFLRTTRLAPAARSPLFEMTLIWCATACDPSVARRARYVLEYLRRTARD